MKNYKKPTIDIEYFMTESILLKSGPEPSTDDVTGDIVFGDATTVTDLISK